MGNVYMGYSVRTWCIICENLSQTIGSKNNNLYSYLIQHFKPSEIISENNSCMYLRVIPSLLVQMFSLFYFNFYPVITLKFSHVSNMVSASFFLDTRVLHCYNIALVSLTIFHYLRFPYNMFEPHLWEKAIIDSLSSSLKTNGKFGLFLLLFKFFHLLRQF